MRKNGTSDSLPKSNFKQRSNDVDSDSEGKFWEDYIKVSKEENLTLKRICKGMPVNENNKNEEMQSTSSDSTAKGARGIEDLIPAIEGPSTSTARGDGALSNGSVQSKRFDEWQEYDVDEWQEDVLTFKMFKIKRQILYQRIIIHEFSPLNRKKPENGIVEYLCPVGYDCTVCDWPLECSNKNFENLENVKTHLSEIHNVPFDRIEDIHQTGWSFPPIERITYKY